VILGLDFMRQNYIAVYCEPDDVQIKFHDGQKHRAEIFALTVEGTEQCLNKILNEHKNVFENRIGCVNHYSHHILMNQEKPFRMKPYPVPEAHRSKVRQHLKDLQNSGIIEKSSTQYINPLVVVIKKSGEIRLCLDARELNKRMSNEHDQPPTIEEVFRRIGNKKYFSTLDVTSAFW